jgi:chlorite dismutase
MQSPIPTPEVRERGGGRGGPPQFSDRRLFMQLLAFGGAQDLTPLKAALTGSGFEAVLYEDLHDPGGVGLLTLHEDPAFFVTALRAFLQSGSFSRLSLKPAYTMFGRTYALGYEPDLNDTLFARPRRTALNPQQPWAVWYPLRRSGSFAKLPEAEQRDILMEHGTIGRAFGEADLGHDVRLACFGLDSNDNDFVIGLMGKDLHPLSVLVQTMRKTRQTSEFIERLGPFFVGRVAWRSAASKQG